MLRVENISTGYGKKQVLFDVSFEVKEGDIILLTGGNGSGKSTILKAIYGLLPLWSGNIFFDNEELTKYSTSELLKKGMAYIAQRNNYFENLTIYENLKIAGSIYTKSELNARLEKVWILPKLYQNRNRTPFNLSGGEKQILVFGMAILNQPKLILFDEPFSELDLITSSYLKSTIKDYNERNGVSFLIVEHKMHISDIKNKEIKINLGHIDFQ